MALALNLFCFPLAWLLPFIVELIGAFDWLYQALLVRCQHPEGRWVYFYGGLNDFTFSAWLCHHCRIAMARRPQGSTLVTT